jgi:predicted transcriptional regulator
LDKTLNIRVHYTWIFVLALVAAIVTTQFSESFILWQRVILGVVVALVFLGAATIRELILSTTAFPRETPIHKITLFVFGGVYAESRDRVIATNLPFLYLARLVSNLVLAAIFYGLYATFVNADNLMMAGVAQWLAYIYFLLFLLHFVPAFPLTGGEIIRLVLWKSTGDYYKATGIASLIGWAAGLFLMFAGVLLFIVTRDWIISLLIIGIGWILQIAAGYTRRDLKTHLVLQDITAGDIMTRDYPVMPRQMNIRPLVQEHILKKGWPYIIVAEGTKLEGILTLNQIKSVPGQRWNNTTIGDIMTPLGKLRTVHLQQTAATLFEEMSWSGIDYIPVMEDENIVGMVDRVALTGLIKTRLEFGA